jgi:hypothetical protein
MTLLTTAALLRGRGGRLPLDADRISGRRLGAVGGILVEARPQLLDLPLRLNEPLFQPVNDSPDDRAGLLRQTVPDVLRDRGRPIHAAVIIRRP